MIEMTVRVMGHRLWFFFGKEWRWNAFDFVLLLVSIFTEWEEGVNLFSSARTLRVFQVVRVFRIIRIVRFFRQLRMMVLSVVSALQSLFWAFALLILIMFVFSIAIMQGLAFHLKAQEESEASLVVLRTWYGTLPTTMFSLMYAISGGADWGQIVEPIARINYVYKVLFTFYIVFTVFGVLNVLTGVFVQTASEIIDRDLIVQSEEARAEGFMTEMKALFDEFD